MKIAFVHDHPFARVNNSYYSQGGLPSYVWDRYLDVFDGVKVIGRELRNSKIDLDKLVLSSRRQVSFNLCYSYHNPIDYLTRNKKVIKELVNVLNTVDAAIIRLPSALGILAVEVCRKMKKPYLLEVVGSAYNTLRHSGILGKLYGLAMDRSMKKHIHNADWLVYVTQKSLQLEYPSRGRSEAISNVNIDRIDEVVLSKRLEKIYDRGSILCLGLIGSMSVPYKGHVELMKAIEPLVNGHDKISIKLKFVGQGDANWLLEKAKELNIQHCIEIVGQVPAGDGINTFLDNIDIYVHPSRSEGLPRVVVEACARACPVLASSVGGTTEIVSGNYIHTPGDYSTLRQQLVSIIEDVEQLAEMARQNFSVAMEYQKEVLNSKRNEFLEMFKRDVMMNR